MDLTRRCNNLTAMTVGVFPMRDRDGWEVAVAIAKITWSVSSTGDARFALPQEPLRLASEATTGEAWSSVRLPTDLVAEKPGTDVIMIGNAHPPMAAEAIQRDVGLRIEARHGTIHKAVRVHGPRHYTQGVLGIRPGPAAPVGITPLVYELAEGGVDRTDPARPLIDSKNPSGRGAARDPVELLGMPAPQIECLGGKQPAGFGPIAASWSPRVELAGRFDDHWRRTRAPLRPESFDPRHNSCAHPDLWSERPLEGNEPCEILGATPSGEWRFKLPLYAPSFEATIAGATTPLDTHLDTFLIRADRRLVELTWRARVRMPRKSEKLETITVREAYPMDAALWRQTFDDLERHARRGAEGGTA
jgi:hypothetical protein